MRLLFTPLIAGKPWNGGTIHTEPLGGSESAVAYMARALAQRGHDVTVVAHGAPGTFDGVQYRHANEIGAVLSSWVGDVWIVSRWLDLLYQWPGVHARAKVFWIHDLPSALMSVPVPFDLMLAISDYQAEHWGRATLGADGTVRYYVSGDGVELDYFKGANGKRDPNRLIYCSNPDRGLHTTARVFQLLRREWPDLELHVFGRAAVYGWQHQAEMPFMPAKGDMENVVLHEPVPRHELAKELKRSWAMLMVTHWPETFCMAALESQAAGTPVLAPPYAALPETVKGGILSYDFLEAFDKLRSGNVWRELSRAGKDWAKKNSWSLRAVEWEKLLMRELVLKGT